MSRGTVPDPSTERRFPCCSDSFLTVRKGARCATQVCGKAEQSTKRSEARKFNRQAKSEGVLGAQNAFPAFNRRRARRSSPVKRRKRMRSPLIAFHPCYALKMVEAPLPWSGRCIAEPVDDVSEHLLASLTKRLRKIAAPPTHRTALRRRGSVPGLPVRRQPASLVNKSQDRL